ncbi:DeoR/GlpR family DNA-binding transcription regulator [Rhizobium helianthi]|uniref:DeoR/GlpR family DNA-binding transcription regulator n=1 Tax=Rhizobium helianthi TaxID=1132695 RepID=A0ABW4M6V6_9HYPH
MSELMLPERQERIRQRLSREGRVVAAMLAEEFGVSEDTIRRDLREMAAAGLCERVYGGALLVGKGRASLSQRAAIDQHGKRALARELAGMIEPRATVFFDAGSTNLLVAECLADDLIFTAITNAPAIAVALADKPSVETILVGGSVDRIVGGALGAQAVAEIGLLTIDLCLIGICGYDEEGRLSAHNHEDALFKRALVRHSKQVATAVSSEKFATPAPFTIAVAGQYQRLVVEEGVDPAHLEPARRAGCQITVARS